jgi:hypothetical protein
MGQDVLWSSSSKIQVEYTLCDLGLTQNVTWRLSDGQSNGPSICQR